MKIRCIVAASVAGLVLATSSAAFAAGPPYKVSVGGSTVYSPSHAIAAASTGTVVLRARNNAFNIVNTPCTSAAINGTVTSGTGINPVLTLPAASTFSGCTMPGGAGAFTRASVSYFVGTGSNATTGSETVAGYVSNIKATMANAVCSFTFEGYATAAFNESTQRLQINEVGYTGNLAITSVAGCLGQLQVGNPMDFVATLNITSTDGVINLA